MTSNTQNGFASEPYILNSYSVRRSHGGVLYHTPYGSPPLYADRDIPLALRTYQLTVPINDIEPMVASTAPSALQISKFQKSLQGPSSSLLAHIAFPHETVLTPPPIMKSSRGNDKKNDIDFVNSFKSFAESNQTSTGSTNRPYTSSSREPELFPDVMMYSPGAKTTISPSIQIPNGALPPPDEIGLHKASDIALLKIARNDGKPYGEDDVQYFRHFYSAIAFTAAESALQREKSESKTFASKARKWTDTMKRLRSKETLNSTMTSSRENQQQQQQQPTNEIISRTSTSIDIFNDAKKGERRLASREVLFTPATQGALAELRAFRSGLQALESRRRRFNAVLGREPSDFNVGAYREREIDDPRVSPFVF